MVGKKRVAILLLILVLILGWRLFETSRYAPTVVPDKSNNPINSQFFVVYFPEDSGLAKLNPEYFLGEGTVEQRLQALVSGPRSEHLLPALPPGTKVLGYRQSGDILVVSFSRELVTAHPGGSAGELVTVYGIVNTLTEIEEIRAVRILVENEPIDTLAGHVSLAEPLEKDPSLQGSSNI